MGPFFTPGQGTETVVAKIESETLSTRRKLQWILSSDEDPALFLLASPAIYASRLTKASNAILSFR